MKAIFDKFGLKKEEVVAFFHYPPTYYHLHVHFIHLKMLHDHSPTRTVFLDDVIENLEFFGGDYYQKKTLIKEVKEGTDLHTIFTNNGVLPKKIEEEDAYKKQKID